ncbi:hypothetical protein VE02_08187 [Pseudogymnoascus sp. 03VT05]|nr:hypothetical protein VE02_08187 [Pseudogymnoascus sp. 03VT05]
MLSRTQTLLSASLNTYVADIAHNIGDIWLPVVDGDFLPAAPSQLIREHRFAKVTTMIGAFISSYVPGVTTANIEHLISLYPVSDFTADPAVTDLSSEFFRAARIFRDILMTCQPMLYGEHIAAAGNDVYLYNWNQTILDPVLESITNETGFGPIHTSEFAYIFGNLSHYDVNGYPFNPAPEDYELRDRGSRSWSTFASVGKPGVKGRDTFQGVGKAFPSGGDEVYVFVAGGPHEGLSAIDGPDSTKVLREQKLRERCEFINSPELIEQLGY